MPALPDLITVEQFRRMPEDCGTYELHHGEVWAVTRPKAKHYQLQRRLVRLLELRLTTFGQVGMEFESFANWLLSHSRMAESNAGYSK